MGLAEPHSAVQEERIVGFRRLFGHGHGCSVRKLVRSADDEGLKGVARVQLMSGGIKIKLGLRRRRRSRGRRVRFGANIFELKLRTSQFGENRLQELPVSFCQSFAKQPRGNANNQMILLGALKTSGAKPGSEAVRVDAAFGVLKDLVPEVHRANLPFATISTAVENIVEIPPPRLAGCFFVLSFRSAVTRRAPRHGVS